MSRHKQRKMAANFHRGWQYRQWKSGQLIRYAERQGVRVQPWQAQMLEVAVRLTRDQFRTLIRHQYSRAA